MLQQSDAARAIRLPTATLCKIKDKEKTADECAAELKRPPKVKKKN